MAAFGAAHPDIIGLRLHEAVEHGIAGNAKDGKPSAGEFEGWIGAQKVKIVAVGIASYDRQHARSQHILNRVRNVRRVSRVSDQSGERSGHGAASFGKGEQRDAAVRGEPAAIECGCDFLARDGWQGEGKRAIVGHGGCG